uniref:Uncharacterized protein n=1 Tax=Rhipicephalus zambeziensis TaxID=60191 RepID=A0A224YC42_9ACAR
MKYWYSQISGENKFLRTAPSVEHTQPKCLVLRRFSAHKTSKTCTPRQRAYFSRDDIFCCSGNQSTRKTVAVMSQSCSIEIALDKGSASLFSRTTLSALRTSTLGGSVFDGHHYPTYY